MTMAKKITAQSAKVVEAQTEAPSAPKPPRRATSSRTAVPAASEPVAAPQTGRTKKAPTVIEQSAAPAPKPVKARQPKQAEEVVAPAPTKPTRGKKAPTVVEQAPAAPVRGMGIGALARQLLLEHQDWPHARIAAEVNARIPGAQATEKSLRWYSCDMRKKGIIGTERVRPQGKPTCGLQRDPE